MSKEKLKLKKALGLTKVHYQGVVMVTQRCFGSDMDPEDRANNPSGAHLIHVTIPRDQDPVQHILDEFHNSVPIACLDDFEIEVTDIKELEEV